ncbi:hypothetical protein [Thermomonospora umbrina]|uniref:Uncharacterized protein n=1 Tax=Thermomonospora umbrina TaxID=111806 RepID=A0A3D9SYJ4_9ACTN|nr:hypothetical protein [Thermomonospora umbrina]REF00648.1 hypothetical protein DFJ69_6204 [Thermomonospora umbrina]
MITHHFLAEAFRTFHGLLGGRRPIPGSAELAPPHEHALRFAVIKYAICDHEALDRAITHTDHELHRQSSTRGRVDSRTTAQALAVLAAQAVRGGTPTRGYRAGHSRALMLDGELSVAPASATGLTYRYSRDLGCAGLRGFADTLTAVAPHSTSVTIRRRTHRPHRDALDLVNGLIRARRGPDETSAIALGRLGAGHSPHDERRIGDAVHIDATAGRGVSEAAVITAISYDPTSTATHAGIPAAYSLRFAGRTTPVRYSGPLTPAKPFAEIRLECGDITDPIGAEEAILVLSAALRGGTTPSDRDIHQHDLQRLLTAFAQWAAVPPDTLIGRFESRLPGVIERLEKFTSLAGCGPVGLWTAAQSAQLATAKDHSGRRDKDYPARLDVGVPASETAPRPGPRRTTPTRNTAGGKHANGV